MEESLMGTYFDWNCVFGMKYYGASKIYDFFFIMS